MNNFPFSKNLFWDCEVADIDLKKNRRYVVERVLTRGQMEDFKSLLLVYNKEEIVEGILKSRELDPKTAHFCSWYFGIPENQLHVSSFHR